MNLARRLLNTAYVAVRYPIEHAIPFWPLEWIQRLQRHRLHAIVRHAYDTVPFYRRAMEERDLHPRDFQTVEDLTKLPLIDGMTVQRDLDAFLSTSYTDNSRLALYSSGSSSGIRRVIFWDNRAVLSKRAHPVRDSAVLRNLVGQRRYVHLHIAPAGSSRFELLSFFQASSLNPPGFVQHHVISPQEPFETIRDRINTIRPQVVSSYGSFAEQFFRFLADHQMTIALPRVWIYGAEMLTPSGRKLIENSFGCPTYSTYQATETGRLGFQCEQRQGFHLNIDLCAVRLVDEDGGTVEPGKLGEVVISNLYNRAMVLLNYRLDDWGVMARESCSCARTLPLLERLEGRSSDMLRLADGRVLSSLTLDTLCDEELQAALQIQLEQTDPGKILWRIVPSSRADLETLRENLLERCRLVLGADTDVRVEIVDHLPVTASGKFPRVISHVTQADAQDSVGSGRAESKDQTREK